jgi:hypothetical protein
MKILNKEQLPYFLSNLYGRILETFNSKISSPSSITQYIEINEINPHEVSIKLKDELRELFHRSDITLPYILIPPVHLGESLATEIVETSQYTGTIEWTPDTGVYETETIYQIKVTLQPKPGYNKYGITKNFFSFCPTGIVEKEHFISTRNDKNDLVITTTMLINVEIVFITENDIESFTLSPNLLPPEGGNTRATVKFTTPQ